MSRGKLKKIIIDRCAKLGLAQVLLAGILMLGFGFGFVGQYALADWTTGKFNSAMDFNGTSDFIFAGDLNENVKTVMFWIKADDIISRKILQLGVSTDYYIEINNSSQIVAQNFAATPIYYIDGTATLTPTIDANWHFVAITDTTAIDASSVYLGRAFVSSTNYYFDGVLDDVKFFDRVLTAKEVAEHYRQDAPSMAQGGTISDSSTVGAALTIRQDSTGDILNLYDGGTEVLTVIDGGKVGIGTASPINLLEINGSLGMYTNPGSDKVTDGDFTGDGSDWTVGDNWTYDPTNDEVDRTAAAATDLEQDVSAIANEIYKVVYTAQNYSAGSVTVSVGGVSGTARSANGTYTEYITATGTGYLKFTPSADAVLSVDTISVQKMAKSATDHIAMWIDDTGAVADKAGLHIRTEDGTTHVLGGNVGIGTTGPDAKLDILDISGAQMRLTYTNETVFTDFTLDSNGNLEIKSTPTSTHGDVKFTSSVSTGANLYVCEGTSCPNVDASIGNTGGNLIVEGKIFGGASCSSDMIFIPGGDCPGCSSFCIDKYEAYNSNSGSVCDHPTCDCTDGAQDEVDDNTTSAIAGSASGQIPLVSISLCAAKKSCENASKHLCTGLEWFQACNYKGSKWDITAEQTTETMDCNTASDGTPANTGASPGCITQEGVFDMIGNVWEWTDNVYISDPTGGVASNHITGYDFATGLPISSGATSNDYGNDYFWAYNGGGDPRAAVRGGNWSDGADDGCFALGLSVAPSNSAASNVGFRCCQ